MSASERREIASISVSVEADLPAFAEATAGERVGLERDP